MNHINHILIVEDTPNLRYDLMNIVKLDRRNRKIFTAKNENQAERLIKSHLFDVIITDVNLDEAGGKKTGGLDVLRAAFRKNKNAKVIVVSAFGKMEVRDQETKQNKSITIEEKVKKMGAFYYIHRPNPECNYLEKVGHFVDSVLNEINS